MRYLKTRRQSHRQLGSWRHGVLQTSASAQLHRGSSAHISDNCRQLQCLLLSNQPVPHPAAAICSFSPRATAVVYVSVSKSVGLKSSVLHKVTMRAALYVATCGGWCKAGLCTAVDNSASKHTLTPGLAHNTGAH